MAPGSWKKWGHGFPLGCPEGTSYAPGLSWPARPVRRPTRSGVRGYVCDARSHRDRGRLSQQPQDTRTLPSTSPGVLTTPPLPSPPHPAQRRGLKESPRGASATSGLPCPHRLVLRAFFPCLPLLATYHASASHLTSNWNFLKGRKPDLGLFVSPTAPGAAWA